MPVSNIITKPILKQLISRKSELEEERHQIDALLSIVEGQPIQAEVGPASPAKTRAKPGSKPTSKKRQLRNGKTISQLTWEVIKKNPGLKMAGIVHLMGKADPQAAGASISSTLRRMKIANKITVRGKNRDYKYYAK